MYIGKSDLSKPIYNVELNAKGDYAGILFDFQESEFLFLTVDGGKTWAKDRFFPDSYGAVYGSSNGLSVIKSCVPENIDNQSGGFCSAIQEVISPLAAIQRVSNPDYKNIRYKEKYVDNPNFIHKISNLKNNGNSLEVELGSIICPKDLKYNNALCVKMIYFNSNKEGFDITWNKTYQSALELTKKTDFEQVIKQTIDQANEPKYQEIRKKLRMKEGQNEYVGDIDASDPNVKFDNIDGIPANLVLRGNLKTKYNFSIDHNIV